MIVVNYNIEYGGYEKHVKYTYYIKLIQDYNIDIFIVCEPNLPKILDVNGILSIDYSMYGENVMKKVVDELNKLNKIKYYYISTDNMGISIISKYPIEKTEYSFVFNIIYSKINILKLIPIHLYDAPFTFFSLRNIPYHNTPLKFNNIKEIVDLSYSTKSNEIEKILLYLKNNMNEKIIISGDFNEPSHLDDINNEWIISKKFQDLGMIDTYRYINKTIRRDKLGYNIDGATCCNILLNEEPISRIDFIYVKNLNIIKSSVLNQYSQMSDHIPVLAELEIDDIYKYKYMKYKVKYYKFK